MSNSVRMGCLVVLAIIGFMVAAPLFRGDDAGVEQPGAVEPVGSQEQQADTNSDGGGLEPLENSEEAADAGSAEFGVETTVNDIHWTIIEAADVTSNLGEELSPQGKLVGVRYSVENLTDTPLTMLGLELTDDAGNSYSYLSDALQFVEDSEACETETIEPDSSITCTAIYDVADNAEGLRAVVTDLNMLGGETEEIPLPVN